MHPERSEAIDKIAAALAKAQGEMTGAAKDSVNPYFKSKYADLASCWDAVRVPLATNGLAVIQMPSVEERDEVLPADDDNPERTITVALATIVTTLVHESGQWFRSELTLKSADTKPQTVGSAITYGRRYSLMAMVGIAPDDDDDGNTASRPGRPAPARRSPQAPPPPPAYEPDPASSETYEGKDYQRVYVMQRATHHKIPRDQLAEMAKGLAGIEMTKVDKAIEDFAAKLPAGEL